jgi:hypothetical protein
MRRGQELDFLDFACRNHVIAARFLRRLQRRAGRIGRATA